MRKRRLNRTSPVTSITTFSSTKTGRVHYCESRLEADALLLLEYDRDIVDYDTQTHMEYQRGSRIRRYSPDIRKIHLDATASRVELKPETRLLEPRNREKFEFIRSACEKAGEPLQLQSDRDVYGDYSVRNYRLLYRYRHEPIDSAVMERFRAEFGAEVITTFGELRHSLAQLEFPEYFAHQLLAHQVLQFDATEKLAFDTAIRGRLV